MGFEWHKPDVLSHARIMGYNFLKNNYFIAFAYIVNALVMLTIDNTVMVMIIKDNNNNNNIIAMAVTTTVIITKIVFMFSLFLPHCISRDR